MGVKFVIDDQEKIVSFDIAGIKQDIGFVSTNKLSTRHLANDLILAVQSGNVYFDRGSETFKTLSQKHDEGLLTIFVEALALPTYCYDNGNRVMLSHDAFIDFMDKVISAYAESIKPKELRKLFTLFMSAKRKKRYENAQKRYEQISQTQAIELANSLLYYGITSRNPYGDYDGLVINI